MADLYCFNCGGDGMVSVIYGNHQQKTLRRTCICCPRCERHQEDFSPRLFEEKVVPPLDVERLVQDGYRFT
ncbi:MAG: hypothetical protein RLZZ308_447 [Candidatus Parcubacteria bacterium]